MAHHAEVAGHHLSLPSHGSLRAPDGTLLATEKNQAKSIRKIQFKRKKILTGFLGYLVDWD